MERQQKIERSIITKFRKQLWRPFVKAVKDYELIKEGDRIAVCISGGKDSFLAAKLLQELHLHGKANFELKFLNMNPGYNKENSEKVLENARILGIRMESFHTNIFNTVENIVSSPCYLCARMRRGHLYSEAQKLGCNKIALGHHYDDVVETILMSMLYSGQYKGMMPKLKSQNFEGMELIRPLYLIEEEDIIGWSRYNRLDFIRCACRFTEKNYMEEDRSSKRLEIKNLIKALSAENIHVKDNIFRSSENIHLDTVIAYKQKGIRHSFLEEYE